MTTATIERPAFKWVPFTSKQRKAISFFTRLENQQYCGRIDHGSVRSSKSTIGLLGFIDHTQNYYPDYTTHTVSGKTTGTIRNNVIKPLKKMLGVQNVRYNYQKQEMYIGKQIYRCVGAGKADSADVIQGDTIGNWYADEVAKHHIEFVMEMFERMSEKGAKFWWNCNPESPYHYVKKDFIDQAKEKNIYTQHWVLDDNKALPEEYKERLKKNLSGVFYKRSILGLWIAAEGVIYPDFEEQIDWIKEDQVPLDLNYKVVGIDYGVTNPQVYGLIGYKEIDKQVHEYVIKEYYWDSRETYQQKTDLEYSKDFKDFIGQEYVRDIIIDPSAASFVQQLRRDGHYNIRNADNTVLDGIRNHSTWLEQKRIHVVKDACPNLIKEYQSYMWDPKEQKKGLDEPLKENDHAMDAICRYPKQTLYPVRGGATVRQKPSDRLKDNIRRIA